MKVKNKAPQQGGQKQAQGSELTRAEMDELEREFKEKNLEVHIYASTHAPDNDHQYLDLHDEDESPFDPMTIQSSGRYFTVGEARIKIMAAITAELKK